MWNTSAVWKQYNKMAVLHFFLANSTLINILFSLLKKLLYENYTNKTKICDMLSFIWKHNFRLPSMQTLQRYPFNLTIDCLQRKESSLYKYLEIHLNSCKIRCTLCSVWPQLIWYKPRTSLTSLKRLCHLCIWERRVTLNPLAVYLFTYIFSSFYGLFVWSNKCVS